MILEERKQDGKSKLYKEIVRKYHQIYNGAWRELDFTKSTKNTLYGCGAIIVLGALASYSLIKKK